MPDIRNWMEYCTEEMMETLLDDIDCCTCENCKFDIKAIALNSLPPKYVVTKKGELYTKLYTLHQQFDVDIITAITRAAEIVSKNPRHDCD